MQVIKRVFLLFLVFFSFQVNAQVHSSRGQFSINYKDLIGAFDKNQAPISIKEKAKFEASMKAIEAYFAEAGQSESANFDAIRGKILENPGRYFLETVVISENDNTKDFQYTVAVRVSINVANLRNTVQSGASVARVNSTEKTPFSFVFVSRQVDSTKIFDDRVYKRQDNSAQIYDSVKNNLGVSEKTSEGESISASKINTYGTKSENSERNSSIAIKSSVTSESGGSTTRKASESSFRLIPSSNLNQIFISKFSQAGYDVIEAAMVESEKFKISDIENDYKSGNDLQPKTLRSIATGMREVQVPYVALGTLDVGLVDKDPQTGLMRVSVTVNAKVWDVNKSIPRTIFAVGPISYAGVGPTEEEARGNALKNAASSAAQELSSRMIERNIH